MKKKYGFNVFGMDRRQKELVVHLERCGKIAAYNSTKEIYSNVIFPIRPEEGYDEIIEKASGSNFFIGKKNLWLSRYPSLINEKLYDYSENECFKIDNAYLTAESALSVAIDNSKKSLINSNVLVVGYGRIGKSLCNLLLPFTKNISVSARKNIDFSLIKSMGLCCEKTNNLPDLSRFDYIFSTVPAIVFDENSLKEISKDALLIDLASIPCTNFKLCKELNINAIRSLSLPALYSPITASSVLMDTIFLMLEEENQ